MLNSVLWNRRITRKNKLLIYNWIVKSTVIWKFNENLEWKLMPMKMDILRISARCSRLERIWNHVIREKINIKNSVLDYIRYKQLNWYGHVHRLDQEWLPRRILQWCPPGRRGKGRPRNSWMQEVTTGMRKREIGDLEWVTREGWRKRINVLYHRTMWKHQ